MGGGLGYLVSYWVNFNILRGWICRCGPLMTLMFGYKIIAV